MHKAHDPLTKGCTKPFEPLFRRGHIADLALLHQGADPIALPPFCHCCLQACDNLVNLASGNQRGLHRRPARWFLIEDRHIHIAELCQSQRARDGRGRHDQNVDSLPFGPQLHSLGHAKAVLLVNDSKAQILEVHVLLKHRMGANKNLNPALLQRGQLGLALGPLVPPGEDLEHDTCRLGLRAQPIQMLPREDFGGRHHNALPAGLYRCQQRHHRHQCLA